MKLTKEQIRALAQEAVTRVNNRNDCIIKQLKESDELESIINNDKELNSLKFLIRYINKYLPKHNQLLNIINRQINDLEYNLSNSYIKSFNIIYPNINTFIDNLIIQTIDSKNLNTEELITNLINNLNKY